jgi:hypothetical protein
MPWRIDFEGEVYREGDLTLDQCGKVERLTDRSWLHINPIKFAGDAVAILAVMHAERTGKPMDDVVAHVGQIKAEKYVDLIQVEKVDDLPAEYRDGFPLEADEPSTGI